MFITLNGKETEVKFTFNSFRHMKDFNVKEIEDIEEKPFLIIPTLESLLLAGLNHDPKVVYTESTVNDFLENFIEEGSLADLLEELMNELQESSFFKSLQKSANKKEKKIKK